MTTTQPAPLVPVHTFGRRDPGVRVTSTRVHSTVDVLDEARIIDSARVEDHVTVAGNAAVRERAYLCQRAVVRGNAHVYGNARISQWAVIEGAAVVAEEATVMGYSRVYDNAVVLGRARLVMNADVANTRHTLVVGPVGSEGRYVTLYRTYAADQEDWGCIVTAGCFTGTLAAFEKRIEDVEEAWGDDFSVSQVSRWQEDYRILSSLGRSRLRQWREESAPDAETRSWWAQRVTSIYPTVSMAVESYLASEHLGDWK